MKAAVHYSPQAADLLRAGQIQADYFKCPAWPDLIETAQALHPVYVHFPLRVGLGNGDAQDTETKALPDWQKIETLLTRTNTPFVNVHLSIFPADYPDAQSNPDFPEMLVENTVRDLGAVIRRFGADRVMAENDHDGAGKHVRHVFQPEFINRVIGEANCGLLLDLSHARLAAMALGMDAQDYLQQLPLNRVREIHLTGIQTYGDFWMERVKAAGIQPDPLANYAGRPLDHLPMTDSDWDFLSWALEQIRSGQWSTPWIVAFECGGVGPLWQAFTDQDALREQVPRLYDLIHP